MRGLAAKMRKAAQALGQFTRGELVDAVDVTTYNERRQVLGQIRDFLRRGEMKRVERGIYRYVPTARKRTKLDVVWHLVRSHRNFGAAEIERLSGAARYTVREYLACLVRMGYLRKTSRTRWLLINDPGPETPVNTAKCRRLKALRREKRGAVS